MERLSDLKIRLCDAEGLELSSGIYAKVVGYSADVAGVLRVRFTVLPSEVASYLDSLADTE